MGFRGSAATKVAARHRLYVHLVWTTRGRERLIDQELARFLCRFLRAMARKERAYIRRGSAVWDVSIGLRATRLTVSAAPAYRESEPISGTNRCITPTR
jgi:hypothetical protein